MPAPLLKGLLSYFANVTSSNVLNENTKKLVVECFTVSEKRPKDVLIESSINFHRVTKKAFLWCFLHLTSSNVLHEILRSQLLNIFTALRKRPKDVLLWSSSDVGSVTFSGRLEDVSLEHIKQKAFWWYLTSSNVLHETITSQSVNISAVLKKRPKSVLKTSRSDIGRGTSVG